MNLDDTLFSFEKYLGLVPDSLTDYAAQDDIGGFHPDAAQAKWGAGAIWDVEGRALYALIRALKPQTIVEIGSGTGCSTNHMAAALMNIQSIYDIKGHITTIDRGNTPHVLGEYQSFVTAIPDDAINWLALQPDHSIDFILEDADHSEALCAAIGELAKSKLKPGGVLLFHDAAHFGVGHDVTMGYDKAGLDFRVYLTEPSDCGWGVWKAPEARFSTEGYIATAKVQDNGAVALSVDLDAIETTILQAQEEPNAAELPIANPGSPAWNGDDDPALAEPPAEKKVKRTRKAKAK